MNDAWLSVKRLALGLVLIALAATVLLLSDLKSRHAGKRASAE